MKKITFLKLYVIESPSSIPYCTPNGFYYSKRVSSLAESLMFIFITYKESHSSPRILQIQNTRK